MSAIEYGSCYWCVLLSGKEAEQLGESIYLHADAMSIDDNGTLLFTSAGRRVAGTEPKRAEGGEGNGKYEKKKANSESEAKEKINTENKDMVYVAFAAGSWKMAYAAKLQDGSPASVEHWKTASGQDALPGAVAAAAGAAGYPANPSVAMNPPVDAAIRR